MIAFPYYAMLSLIVVCVLFDEHVCPSLNRREL